MVLPLLKLGTLALKTLSKPIAGRLKKEAGLHPKFRQLIVSMAQILIISFNSGWSHGLFEILKSGSKKSLAAGGLSALLLWFIYTELPQTPHMRELRALGISAALLVVMGSRFKKSGKIFPAGVVSFVSLVMSSGYLHGILRSLH